MAAPLPFILTGDTVPSPLSPPASQLPIPLPLPALSLPHRWAVAPFLLVGVSPLSRSSPYPAGWWRSGLGSGSSLSLSTSAQRSDGSATSRRNDGVAARLRVGGATYSRRSGRLVDPGNEAARSSDGLSLALSSPV
ncbi:Os05g0382550 [Oryza sativa Japonica Group]|uniref:Os05g0382550 protein n=2 Tax=Oryza sativa subsp. japonica TaxID=39947 RepID=A0A0P0WLZ3_ORYSJ|nr:hypothetical protein OsJ_18372 [Oryza sativa Japonica Group]KAB8099232.1 hypothetical protein EE612_029173 [Oryza sativa]BAH93128.1 Os05g0382550 [Oryza sativa Japonica Group]BAS93780.1 Os05g0382550 [Oryza sativa Japonica Group]|eukprot:NP_001174400.1 Os05g0382550 [Oryza sativa Japonica Group]